MGDLIEGRTFAGCRLETMAARGGMGVVWKATQLALDRPVALKAIAPDLAESHEFRERFQRESQLAASIDHPNVLPVYEAGEIDGTLYLIMRWVEGSDMRWLLRERGRLAPEHALRLLIPVAAALAAAHRRGLIHRDIKPANVLISRDEHVYLTDFGIARMTTGDDTRTRTGALIGTIDYTAPERFEGDHGDEASDIYAFGCMLYETLIGEVPFKRSSDVSKMFAHLKEPPPSVRAAVPAVPESVDEIVRTAMAKGPGERYSSASALVDALTAAVAETGSGPVPAISLFSRPTRRARQLTPAHNLASELTSLIGRRQELAELAELLAEQRLITVCGPGGVGKTRVALRAASSALGQFPHGVWFVDLAAIDRPGDVALAVMSSVRGGIEDQPGTAALDTISRELRDRTLLLVLDNCEHVLDAAAELAGRLLADCEGVRILATSREPLALPGERVARLEPLPTGRDSGAQEPPAAVALFLDRAAMHGVSWDESPATVVEAITQVCRRLDGIPLAIELAAARSRAVAPAKLLEHLDERLRLLARPQHWRAHARQQTLEATISWSYELLTEPEQATLRRLAVFRGGFTLEAGAAVCADIATELETLERVTLLVDRSVVSIQSRGETDRYRLLESIALFAEHRLHAHDEQAGARDRHARHLLELAREATAKLVGPEQRTWARVLDAEEDNLGVALAWCLDREGDRKTGAALAAVLGVHWVLRGRNTAADRWLKRALSVADELPPALHARILLRLSMIDTKRNDASGSARAIEAVSVARRCDDPHLLAEALTDVAYAHRIETDEDAVSAAVGELRALQPRLSDYRIRVRALHACAVVALGAGQYAQAARDAGAGRAVAEQAGNRLGLAFSGLWLAYALALGNDLTGARETAGDAMQAAVAVGYEGVIADLTFAEADLAIALGDLETAAQRIPRAAAMFHAQNRLGSFGDALRLAALLSLKRQEAERAAVLLGAARGWTDPMLSFRGSLLPELAPLAELLQARLGAEAFASAHHRGTSLGADQAAKLVA